MSASFPGHRARRALAAALVAIVLGACGRGGSTTATDAPGDLLVVAAPEDDAAARTTPPPTVPDATPIASRTDLRNEARVLPLKAWVDPDDSHVLHVTYAGGTGPCHGARLAIDEGPATVRVILFVGTLPEGEGTACYLVGAVREITATLDHPLGSREILSS